MGKLHAPVIIAFDVLKSFDARFGDMVLDAAVSENEIVLPQNRTATLPVLLQAKEGWRAVAEHVPVQANRQLVSNRTDMYERNDLSLGSRAARGTSLPLHRLVIGPQRCALS